MGRTMLGVLPLLIALAVPSSAAALSSVAVTSTFSAPALVLDGEGTSDTRIVKVGDLSLSTDSAAGLTVTLSSGDLAKIDGEPIVFQVTTVADGAAAPAAASFTVPSGSLYAYVTFAAGSEERDVYIKYSTRTIQDPGTYDAQIAASVTDN